MPNLCHYSHNSSGVVNVTQLLKASESFRNSLIIIPLQLNEQSNKRSLSQLPLDKLEQVTNSDSQTSIHTVIHTFGQFKLYGVHSSHTEQVLEKKYH